MKSAFDSIWQMEGAKVFTAQDLKQKQTKNQNQTTITHKKRGWGGGNLANGKRLRVNCTKILKKKKVVVGEMECNEAPVEHAFNPSCFSTKPSAQGL